MYYAFIDGHYFGSSRHLAYLKNRVDEDIEVINAFHATIYRGERSYCSRFYDGTCLMQRGPALYSRNTLLDARREPPQNETPYCATLTKNF